MLTGSLYFVISVALALAFAIAWKPQLFGWWLTGLGAVFLIHAGTSMAIIWANNNVVPSYVNYWQLFATVPVGMSLMAMGLGVVGVRACVHGRRRRRN